MVLLGAINHIKSKYTLAFCGLSEIHEDVSRKEKEPSKEGSQSVSVRGFKNSYISQGLFCCDTEIG